MLRKITGGDVVDDRVCFWMRKQTAKRCQLCKEHERRSRNGLWGCSAFSGEKKKWICGVGVSGGTNNLAMCRDMATARAASKLPRP